MYLDNEIYNKINNHIMLDNNDIKKIIYNNSRGKVKCIFDDTYGVTAYYAITYNCIVIDKKLRSIVFKDYLDISYDAFKMSKERRHFIIDLYNLQVLTRIFHELRHYEHISRIKFGSLTPRDFIIRECYKFVKDHNSNFYDQYHDLYYHEYDAIISMYEDTLSIIEKCNGLTHDSIVEYNKITAKMILHSHGVKYKYDTSKIYDKFTSPISFFKFILRFPNDPKKKKLLCSCVDYLNKQSQSEYLKLLNGVDISNDTLSLLLSFANGSLKTTNIFDELSKKEKTLSKK